MATNITPMEQPSFNGSGPRATTPTSSPAPPPLKTPHSVAMPTPVLQAVYDRGSQQPLYILQSNNGPTLIPVQMAPPRGGGVATNSTLAIPTSLGIDQLAGKGVPSLQTPTPGTPKQISFSPAAGTFGGTALEGLMQPSQLLVPQTNGGMQLSEAGPIRTIVRQAARERPSPVAMDGEGVMTCVYKLHHEIFCHFE